MNLAPVALAGCEQSEPDHNIEIVATKVQRLAKSPLTSTEDLSKRAP